MADKPDYARLTAEERRATRETLAALSPDQWTTPSLCENWTIRDLAGHLASADDIRLGRLLATLLAAGFSVEKTNDALAQRWAFRDTEDILAAVGNPRLKGMLRLAPAAALAEALIHGQDIRRPLGLTRRHPEESLRAVAEATCTKQLATGARGRIAGLRLVASDIEWSFGEGLEVTGTAEALIMAANGRRAALEELTGPGQETLATR